MPRINKFVEQNYTNSIGQVLQPGDEVLVVTKRGYSKKIRTYKGRYDGVFVNPRGDVVSLSVFGSTRTMYKREGTEMITPKQHKWNPELRKYETVAGVPYERPKYVAYKRVVSAALPNKQVFKISND